MRILNYSELTTQEIKALLDRPAIENERVFAAVAPVLEDVKANGLASALKYARQFDGFQGQGYSVPAEEFQKASERLDPQVKEAIDVAAKNIRAFHERQFPKGYEMETVPGVKCSRQYRPIENVGLYIPGGSAVLPSTMLMLGIPASIAGCRRIIACSPVKDSSPNDALLYAAYVAGVTEFYTIGGSQAIALMAYGSKGSEGYPDIPKVDKIFGPGNQYVTAAKMIVSNDTAGCLVDMPAGPSELLVIADETCIPAFVAADLLSQAEHGPDSQVILVANSSEVVRKVVAEVELQIVLLPRKDIAASALKNSFCLTVVSIEEALRFSNLYAPEHLSLQVEEPEKYIPFISNAGSVFLGSYSPESAGDYASGTNHSLPTYGYSRSIGGVSVESFMKTMTFQYLSKEGLSSIAGSIKTLAETEGLSAHKNAVSVRMTDEAGEGF